MTLYVVIGLSWLSVGLALLVLRLVREQEPESQWRLLLVAAAAPFLLFPVARGCSFLVERLDALFPLFGGLGPLALLTGAGAAVAVVRSLVVVRRHCALLARCAPPEGVTAEVLRNHVRRLSEAAGLACRPRVLLYPRGAHVCALGGRRPTIVVSRGLLTCLEEHGALVRRLPVCAHDRGRRDACPRPSEPRGRGVGGVLRPDRLPVSALRGAPAIFFGFIYYSG